VIAHSFSFWFRVSPDWRVFYHPLSAAFLVLNVKCQMHDRDRQSIIRQICGHLCDLRYQSWAFLAVIQLLVNCAERTTQGNVYILETTVSLMLLHNVDIQSRRAWACSSLLAVNVRPALTESTALYTHLFPWHSTCFVHVRLEMISTDVTKANYAVYFDMQPSFQQACHV